MFRWRYLTETVVYPPVRNALLRVLSDGRVLYSHNKIYIIDIIQILSGEGRFFHEEKDEKADEKNGSRMHGLGVDAGDGPLFGGASVRGGGCFRGYGIGGGRFRPFRYAVRGDGCDNRHCGVCRFAEPEKMMREQGFEGGSLRSHSENETDRIEEGDRTW